MKLHALFDDCENASGNHLSSQYTKTIFFAFEYVNVKIHTSMKTWSGCRESNPVFTNPNRTYYRYTTPRRPFALGKTSAGRPAYSVTKRKYSPSLTETERQSNIFSWRAQCPPISFATSTNPQIPKPTKATLPKSEMIGFLTHAMVCRGEI